MCVLVIVDGCVCVFNVLVRCVCDLLRDVVCVRVCVLWFTVTLDDVFVCVVCDCAVLHVLCVLVCLWLC